MSTGKIIVAGIGPGSESDITPRSVICHPAIGRYRGIQILLPVH